MLSYTNDTTVKLNNQFADQLQRPKHKKNIKMCGVMYWKQEILIPREW